MKKCLALNFLRMLAVVLVAVMLMSISAPGYAEGKPGPSDLADIQSGIEYPREDEYFPEYEYAVVKAPKGHSVYGFGSADHLGSSYTVLDGETVKVLAERKGYSCVIVLSQNKGRWINSKYLVPAPDKESGEAWVQIYSFTDNGDSSKETEYRYNEDQMVTALIKHEINKDGTESETETIRTFDADGMITGSETRDSETGELIGTELWYYTPERKLEKICKYDRTGTLKEEQKNSYSSDGYVIECISYDDNGDQTSRTSMQFDLDGNQLSSEHYDECNKLAVRIENTYNSDNEKEKTVTLDASGKILYARDFSYIYDADGRLTEAAGTYSTGILKGTKEIIRYTYDLYGNLMQETMTYDGEEVYRTSNRWGLLENGEITQVSE